MAYKVVIEKTAAKTIGKMDARPRTMILSFLKALAQSNNARTEFDGKALQGDKRIWRFRLSNYRVLADINDKTVTITILKAGHRREVYR